MLPGLLNLLNFETCLLLWVDDKKIPSSTDFFLMHTLQLLAKHSLSTPSIHVKHIIYNIGRISQQSTSLTFELLFKLTSKEVVYTYMYIVIRVYISYHAYCKVMDS